MIDFISNFLAHHHYDKVGILLDENTRFLNHKNIDKSTDIKSIDINIKINHINTLFRYKKSIEIINDNYDLLCLVEYKNIDYKLLHGDTVLLFYKKEDIDFFSTWEILRKRFNHIYIVRELKEDVREISRWDKEEANDIELSIILPVYNVAKYLPRCIETLTKWDAAYIEFLFINDGSNDDSTYIIEEAIKKDSRIKLINKPNGGCASAREKGLEVAKGRYIGFVDPDDFIDPTMFKKLFARALSGTYDIAYCGYNEYYDNTKKIKPVKDLLYKPYVDGTIIRHDIDLLMGYLRIGIWRMIFKRKFLSYNNIHFHIELKRYDDLPFKVETLALANSVVAVDEYLYFYRLEREGQDVSMDDERLYVHFEMFDILDQFFVNKSEYQLELYKIIKRDTHNWALKHLKPSLRKEYKSRIK